MAWIAARTPLCKSFPAFSRETGVLRRVCVKRACRARSAGLQSISICPNRRGPRRFCGARLCEPQHVDSDRRAGFVKTLGGRQSSCGSQTRAPLVAASPRCAVSQVFNLPPAACEQRSADNKSALRQIKNLRYGKQILRRSASDARADDYAGEIRCLGKDREYVFSVGIPGVWFTDGSGTGVSSVCRLLDSHGRDARATTLETPWPPQFRLPQHVPGV
jgi:hypothetical protein